MKDENKTSVKVRLVLTVGTSKNILEVLSSDINSSEYRLTLTTDYGGLYIFESASWSIFRFIQVSKMMVRRHLIKLPRGVKCSARSGFQPEL